MPADLDHFEAYYADKLWQLLPSVYRAQDSTDFNRNGPLREMVNRIGAQAAILRRGIDRLWEDQSIETCDDWVIAYIGDLLATNLVSSQNAAGQRVDVAKTIYYRRRKGTMALLEELAYDVTRWDVRVVEFFRRLGRTRHNFDPEIGAPAKTSDPARARVLQRAEGLLGKLTGSPIGGWADLRNVYGAAHAGPDDVGNQYAMLQPASAFDEFYHTGDFRRGKGATGWHGISKLGVYIWRLTSFDLAQTTPVALAGCSGHFTFDPTGRSVPLFAARSRAFGDQWVSPEEWQLPTPISRPLLDAALASPSTRPLYATLDPADGITIVPNAMGVYSRVGVTDNLVPPQSLSMWPDLGRFRVNGALPPGVLLTSYHYGFSSTIGAGPFDRRDRATTPIPQPSPTLHLPGGGALPALPGDGSIILDDSLTWTAASDPPPIGQLTIAAAPRERPVIRLQPPHAWTFTGRGIDSVLVLDGLLISGSDIVLAGDFAEVMVNCCSFDPGEADSSGDTAKVWTAAADGRDLLPTVLRVQGTVAKLTIRRSISGAIRTESAGVIEILSVTDSIVQSSGAIAGGLFSAATLTNPGILATTLRNGSDALGQYLHSQLSPATVTALNALQPFENPSPPLVADLANELNAVVSGPALFTAARFQGHRLSALALAYVADNPTGTNLARLNRVLLKEALPAEFLETADLALSMTEGLAELTRTTVMGPAALHRIEASETILDDLAYIENTQDGCVRFSATSDGSIVPRRYECVTVAPKAPLFTSRRFAQPGYGQVSLAADRMIESPTAISTILQGAENGSEMGAFARDMNPIRSRSLLIKYQEYMPIGLTPVLVYVT